MSFAAALLIGALAAPPSSPPPSPPKKPILFTLPREPNRDSRRPAPTAWGYPISRTVH